MPEEDDSEGDLAARELEIRQRVHNWSPEALLQEARNRMMAHLYAKLEVGTVSHQELAILRNLCRDNGLTMGIPPEKGEVPGSAQHGVPLDLPDLGKWEG